MEIKYEELIEILERGRDCAPYSGHKNYEYFNRKLMKFRKLNTTPKETNE